MGPPGAEPAASPPGDPAVRLDAVVDAYAQIVHTTRRHRDAKLATLLHRGHQVTGAQRQLHRMIRDLIAAAAQTGAVQEDITPDEPAGYCLHAVAAASTLPSKAAVRRLVTVTLAGLQPST